MRKSLLLTVAPILGSVALVGLTAETALAAASNLETFESYSDGNIDGQGGWTNTGGYDANVKTLGDGNKVLQISNAKTSGSFGDMPIAPFLAESAGQSSTGAPNNHFVTSFDFQSAVSFAQPGLYVDLSPDNGTGGRMGYIGISDSGAGLDVLAYGYDSGINDFPLTSLTSVSYGDWHTISIDMTFLDGPDNDVVKYFVDGVLLATLSSWEEYYADYEANPNSVDVRTDLFRINGGPFGAQTQLAGYGLLIDNLSYSASASTVPLPGAALLFASGLLGLGFSSRKTGRTKPTSTAA